MRMILIEIILIKEGRRERRLPFYHEDEFRAEFINATDKK